MQRTKAFLRHLTVAQAEEVKARREADESMARISGLVGVHRWVISDFVLAFDAYSDKAADRKEKAVRNKAFFERNHDKIVELGGKGCTIREIAQQLNFGAKEIRHYIKRHGIEFGRVSDAELSVINSQNGKATQFVGKKGERATKPAMSKSAMMALGMRV